MARIALPIAGGIAGAIIGNLILPGIGGAIGAAIGSAAGGYVGGILDPIKQEGPRLSDLRLQRSTYGGMLPIIYGQMRTAGNVIWQTDLEEHSHTSGGKGGSGTETTTYSYTVSLAIAFCEGPITLLRRVWANGRLVYDTTQGSSEENDENFNFVLYLGDETQLPDPTMETVLGAGNVPAYRGVAYIVLTDLDLSQYGNAIPNIEAEIIAAPLGAIPRRISTFDTPLHESFSSGGAHGVVSGYGVTDDLGSSEIADNIVIAGHGYAFGDTYTEEYRDAATGDTALADQSVGLTINSGYAGIENTLWASCIFTGTTAGWVYRGNPRYSFNLPGSWNSAARGGIKVGNYFVSIYGDGPLKCCRFALNEDGEPDGSEEPNLISGEISPSGTIFATLNYCSDGEHFFVDDVAGGYIYKLALDTMAVVDYYTKVGLSGNHKRFYQYRDFFAFNVAGLGFSNLTLLQVTGSGDDAVWTPLAGAIEPFDYQQGAIIPIIEGRGLVFGRDGVVSLEGVPQGVTLAEIVTDQSLRAGLTEADIDVTELTDIVDGYIIAQQQSVRANIEPLQRVYFFDGAEIDDRNVFRKRGGLSIQTIPDGDLAAHEDGSELPEVIAITRTQEVDIPAVLNLNYVNHESDYHTGSQRAARQTTRSQSSMTINVPVALTDAKAKQVAWSNLMEAWLERDRAQISLPMKYARLAPMDVHTVRGKNWRIRSVTETRGGVRRMDMVPSLGAIYTQPGVAAGSPGMGTPTLKVLSLTDMMLLDIPLYSDTEYANGYGVAMWPRTTGGLWPGASLQKSPDGVTYAQTASTTIAATVGSADDALGNFLGGNVVDEVNSVTISLLSGSLSGTTLTAVLNGANTALIGHEIVAFRDAVLTSDGTYTLTGLLRGRRGTEWAMVQHEAGERFVLLPSVDVDAPSSERNLERQYKAVTFGKTLDTATAESFTNTGNRLKPYAPVNLVGGIDDSDDTILEWTPRTRTGGQWQDGIDAILSEAESYVVEIWDASYTQCARIIEVTGARTTTYTTAQQTTDFGAAQEHVYFTVLQLGVVIGTRGRGVAPGSGASDDAPLSPIAPYSTGPLNPPPSGTVDATLVWSPQTAHYAMSFTIGQTYVAQFTTVAAENVVVTCGEYASPPIFRHVKLCTDSAGLNMVAGTEQYGTTATSGPVALAASTTYYFIVRAELANGDPSGPLGQNASMVIELIHFP